MKFTKLFGLSLTHPYYSDGVGTDFAIEPTPSTVRLLANYRCVLKSGRGWVRAYASNDPDLPWPKGVAFTFRLRLENPDFALFTDLSDYASKSELAPVYYTNAKAGPPGPLTLTSRPPERQQEHFTWESGTAGGKCRFKLGGRPLADTAERQLKVEVAGAEVTATYKDAENAVEITGASSQAGNQVTISFNAQPARRQDSFADAEIRFRFDRPKDPKPDLGDFQIVFKPRSAWRAYYLVIDPTSLPSDFKISDFTIVKLDDKNQPTAFANSPPPRPPGRRPQGGPHRGPARDTLPRGAAYSISVGQARAVPSVDGVERPAPARSEPAGRPTAQPCAWPVHEIRRQRGGRFLPGCPDLTRRP